MTKRILLVDDTSQILQTLEDALGAQGYKVETCDLSADAWDLARDLQPDLIFLDVNMPGMSGWEVLEVLRLSPETRRIPVIVSSADYPALQQREHFLHAKGIEVLYRPFDIDELWALVDRVIGPA
jgi:DNA-binding response OmpR family regulator